MKPGRSWKQGRKKFRWLYTKYKGVTYRVKQIWKKGKWVIIGIVFVLLLAGGYAPAGEYGWLFKQKWM